MVLQEEVVLKMTENNILRDMMCIRSVRTHNNIVIGWWACLINSTMFYRVTVLYCGMCLMARKI